MSIKDFSKAKTRADFYSQAAGDNHGEVLLGIDFAA
jgi:hypothetical protein